MNPGRCEGCGKKTADLYPPTVGKTGPKLFQMWLCPKCYEPMMSRLMWHVDSAPSDETVEEISAGRFVKV